jgi:hypothetical protein
MSSAGDKDGAGADETLAGSTSFLEGRLSGDYDPASQHLKNFISSHSFRTNVAQPTEAKDFLQGTLEVARSQVGIDQSGHHARWAPRILGEIQRPKPLFIQIEGFLEEHPGAGIITPIPAHLGQPHAVYSLTSRI